jgi:hypothetical protein
MNRHLRTRTPSGIPGALVTPRLPGTDEVSTIPPSAPADRNDGSAGPLPRRPTEK